MKLVILPKQNVVDNVCQLLQSQYHVEGHTICTLSIHMFRRIIDQILQNLAM
jgi:hypothetical protein